MKIEPYQSIDGTPFDTTKDQLVAIHGTPKNKRTNRINLEEYDYGSKIFRFNEGNELQEVTIGSEKIEIDGRNHLFDDLEDLVKNEDEEYFECYGFFVSPKLGIAFDPFHKPWITCFNQLGLNEWKKI